MKARILLFAALREKLNASELEIDFAEGQTVSDLARKLLGSDRNIMFAINDELCDAGTKPADGDSVAFIPPMAGG